MVKLGVGKSSKAVSPPLRGSGFFVRSAAAAPDKPPFESVWQAARPRVWGLTARLSGSVDTADDLTKEVAVQALRGYDAFRGEADPLTWLFRIAIHTVVRHREKTQAARRSASGASLDELEALDSLNLQAPPAHQPENRLLEAEPNAVLRRALDTLPDDLRVPLILHVYEEMTCRVIAETLAIPLGTVLSRLHTARRRMKTILEQEPSDAS